MADILTQIQDELDMVRPPLPIPSYPLTSQLLHQMHASLTYIKTRAPPAAIPGQPTLSSLQEAQAQAAAHSQGSDPSQIPPTPVPASPDEFQKDIRELSRDLVVKEHQIEILIGCLPGLNATEAEQVQRMKELERELDAIEGERERAVREKEGLVRLVEERIGVVGGMR